MYYNRHIEAHTIILLKSFYVISIKPGTTQGLDEWKMYSASSGCWLGRLIDLKQSVRQNLAINLTHISAPQSKNAVSTNITHSRYIYLMSNFSSIHFHKGWMYIMFDIVDTACSYGRGLTVCSSLQKFSMTKESIMHAIWNADRPTAFLLCGADIMGLHFVWWQALYRN